MPNNRSLNRVLRDSLGKGLTKEEVRILAKANARANLSSDNLDKMTEADLVLWASDVDGAYRDSQIRAYGMRYR